MERTLSILSPPRALPSVTTRPHGLLEAPRPGEGDSILYSDVLGGGVYCVPVSGDSDPETVVPKRRGIGGLVVHRDGGIVVTDNPVDPDKGGTVFHARAEVAGVEVEAATV